MHDFDISDTGGGQILTDQPRTNSNIEPNVLTQRITKVSPLSDPTQAKQVHGQWGRSVKANNLGAYLQTFFVLAVAPIIVYLVHISSHAERNGQFNVFHNSLFETISELVKNPVQFGHDFLPVITWTGIAIYFSWYLLLLVLTLLIPGPKGVGHPTPAGHVLEYDVNGLAVFLASHAIVGIMVMSGIIKATLVVDHLGSLLVIANIWGLFLAVLSYIKAFTFPSYPHDNKVTGVLPYDFLMGVEFNPRVGKLDFKLFHVGRLAMISWSIINLSFAAKQYELFGKITNSMVLTVALQLLYIVDFFVREDWYLRTIDIEHDHFGFYLAWGHVWLVWIYTASSSVLSRNAIELPWYHVMMVLLLCAFSYTVFLQSNQQKDRFRKTHGQCTIFGKPATGLKVTYTTIHGEMKESLLLTSGWWGVARHFNYFADILLSLSIGLATGSASIVAYAYFLNMFVLLIHRSYRDDSRCRDKYGPGWEKYCAIVKYRIFPGIF